MVEQSICNALKLRHILFTLECEAIMATLLIVDDHPMNVRLLVTLLGDGEHHELHVATNGRTALEIARRVLPDLILLDVMMPDMDGFEVCRQLKASPETADIVVIFVTALDEPISRLTGLEIGGADYITKPYAQEEVLARVNVHLALREKQLQLERLRRQDQEYFARIEAIRKDLLDQMQHDVKGPLANIKAAAYVVSRLCDSPDPRLAVNLKRITGAVDEIVRMMDKVLQVATLETGRAAHKQRVEVLPIIHHILTLFGASAEEKGITLTTDLDTLPLQSTISVDPDQIISVLSNLISNALKFTRPGGDVSLRVMLDDRALRLEVADTGCGISADHLEKIFQRLYRVPTDTDEVEGTGLGLYIVKSIVEQHGGSIWVKSEPGVGSTFYIDLPQ